MLKLALCGSLMLLEHQTQEQQRAVDEAEAALAVDRVEHLLERSKAERRCAARPLVSPPVPLQPH